VSQIEEYELASYVIVSEEYKNASRFVVLYCFEGAQATKRFLKTLTAHEQAYIVQAVLENLPLFVLVPKTAKRLKKFLEGFR
jgi:hypothetical protein